MIACCAGITPDRVQDLKVIGGSHDPFSEPYGELRQCAACGGYFLYTRDHDNEIGYQPSPAALTRMTAEQVKQFVPRAIATAQKVRAHYETKTGPSAEKARAELDEELQRLTSTA